ncbi:hypothetical protein H5410_002591, partial [Solanum commersonii]
DIRNAMVPGGRFISKTLLDKPFYPANHMSQINMILQDLRGPRENKGKGLENEEGFREKDGDREIPNWKRKTSSICSIRKLSNESGIIDFDFYVCFVLNLFLEKFEINLDGSITPKIVVRIFSKIEVGKVAL